MQEPEALRRGKAFQRLVMSDYAGPEDEDGVRMHFETTIPCMWRNKTTPTMGRADILVTGTGDFVSVYEIKSTEWDKINPKNIKKNLWRHQKQLFGYVDKFLNFDKIDVCLGIIYPAPPSDAALRTTIESYLEGYGVPAYWFSEIRRHSSIPSLFT